VVVALLATHRIAAPSWAGTAGALATLGGGTLAVVAASGGVAAARRHLPAAAALGAPLGVALYALGGGAGSPASALVALCVLAWTWRRGARVAAVAAAATALVLALAHAAVAGTITFADGVNVIVTTASVVGMPVWLHSRRFAPAATPLAVLASGDASEGRDRSTEHGPPVAAEPGASNDADDAELLSSYLQIVRESVGAEHAVLWRWGATRETLEPAAWSSNGATAPLRRDADEWLPLVTWSAQEQTVHCAGAGVAPRLAAAPGGVAGPHQFGSLSVYAVDGLGESREVLKERLPRLATHAGVVARLLDTRRTHARQTAQMDALLRATQAFRSTWSVEALGASVCDHALRVTSATRACLVRLGGEAGVGEVQSVTPGHPIGVGLRVLEHSYTAAACADGVPRIWEDARALDAATPLYGAGERPRPIGSLGVVPLVREARVVGALVLEGDAPGDVLLSDARPASLLAALAAVSFEALLDVEEIAHRARTDQLTGLASRRHFDEHLSRTLAEADRYGGVVSLIVANIDQLARVTDEHGPGAGEVVLQAVARTLKDGARAVDLCAAFGTEEIAILLPHTPLADACQVAERLRRAVEARAGWGEGGDVHVTASFGVAGFPESAHRREELIPAVSRALERAKSDGRNCVRYAPQISSQRKS